jgi:hypothetical protein
MQKEEICFNYLNLCSNTFMWNAARPWWFARSRMRVQLTSTWFLFFIIHCGWGQITPLF